MTKLLVKTFIKDYNNTSDSFVRRAYGFLASIVGIICNVLLCTAKIVIGLLFSSIAILADGINNLSDAGSSVASLFGFKLACAPPDEKHPYGHARYEYLAGLVIAFIILMVSFQLIGSSIEKIINKGETKSTYITFIVLGISIALKLWMALFYRKMGKTIDSTTLLAASADSRNDVLATAAVIVCSVISMTTSLNLDGYFGIAVGLFVLYSGIRLCIDTLSPLIGETPPKDLTARIIATISGYEGVKGMHDMMIHNYGPNKFYASIHIEVDSREDILVSHDMIDEIEKDVREGLGVFLVVHLDPVVLDDPKTEAYRNMLVETISEIDSVLSMHDFRAVLGKTHTNLIFDLVLPPKYHKTDEEIKKLVQEKLHEKDALCFAVISIDRNYIGD